MLIAVNELIDKAGRIKPKAVVALSALIDDGTEVFIDSGVFWLTNEHKRKHGITMNEALQLPPEEIDGFDWLWNGYQEVHDAYKNQAWGFIELDQGGAENKRRTRAKMNNLGMFPMPVYHPLNDGFDYFDEVASTHDRICMGNIVQAHPKVRLRLIHTLAERHRRYPDLWVHLLGYTVNQWVSALPVDSADSSSWAAGVIWAKPADKAMNKSYGFTDIGFLYRLGSDTDDPDGNSRASQMGASVVMTQQRNWRHYMARRDELLGATPYPPITKEHP